MHRAGSCTLGLQAGCKPTSCSPCCPKLSPLIICENSGRRAVEQHFRTASRTTPFNPKPASTSEASETMHFANSIRPVKARLKQQRPGKPADGWTRHGPDRQIGWMRRGVEAAIGGAAWGREPSVSRVLERPLLRASISTP